MAKKKTEEISKSKAKREQRQKEVARERRHKLTSKIIGTTVLVVVVGALAGAIGFNIYKIVTRTASSSEFSACLTEDGLIQNTNAASLLTLADYENHTVPLSEVSATSEEVEADITATLEANKELITDSAQEIADGDTVNIDYVGTVDGTEFEGGSSDGAGYDLTIGSGTFVDDFETQLIGHKAGESLTVEVTFPEDYSSAEVAGKDASFAVTINGIYVTPVLTDEFVKAHLSEQASTAEEYRSIVENKFYEQHLQEYLENYITDNTTVVSYPTDYLKNTKATLKYNDEYNMEYYNQMFAQYGLDTYKNVWDTKDGINNELAYEKDLTNRAKEAVKEALVYQAIYEKAGLAFDTQTYLDELITERDEEYVTSMTETYGQGYLIQEHIREVVIDYLMETAKVA